MKKKAITEDPLHPSGQAKARPAQPAIVTQMAAEQARRACRTSWVTDAVRAEMLRRYKNLLESPTDEALKNFLRWVVQDARYLAVEGNFALFSHRYLAAQPDETTGLWELAGDGPV